MRGGFQHGLIHTPQQAHRVVARRLPKIAVQA